MKKKVAICANGWNYDSLYDALEGIKEYAQKEDFDIFVFLSFASYSEQSALMQGELNIYELMDPEDYDGIIVFSTALNSVNTAVSLCQRAREKNIPVVSIGMELEGADSVCVSNDEGMRELVTHLIKVHNVKRAFFIGGTDDHVDSIARLRVTREVFEENGLSFTDEDYGYGRWSNRYTAEVTDRVIDSKRGLPDVFICANDIMAMACATQLADRGYLVPDDVMVTGFDNCREGKFFYPALSSVDQNYREIGYKACDLIFDRIRGREDIVREVVHSHFACGNSCRCKGDKDYDSMRIQYCRDSFRRDMNAKLLEQNERVIRQWLADMPNYNAIKQTLCEHFERNHQFEGEGFHICVNEDFFRDIMLSEKELWERGKKAGIEPLVSLVNGQIVNGLEVNPHKIVPGYTKVPGEQKVIFFLPMHHFEFNYGYVVVTGFPYIFSENMLYPYMEKLQQSIRLMRTNLRLKALSDRDQMTGLYNRFGYENKALPLYEFSLHNGSGVMVMFVDINYMKKINDQFGHLHGDNAIRTVVAAIKENIPDDSIAVRFGGDEFLLISPICDEKEAPYLKERILKYLDEKNKEKTVPYEISVSIGYVVTDPVNRPSATLEDYIIEADKQMYEIKKEMHMKNDRRKA
ncbi:MAG: GGDEF domain-containing protein [Lachnospiraceae bacterium]|nr:GGDEF domain-containing protein [Lachnospiraceae bacterium]